MTHQQTYALIFFGTMTAFFTFVLSMIFGFHWWFIPASFFGAVAGVALLIITSVAVDGKNGRNPFQ